MFLVVFDGWKWTVEWDALHVHMDVVGGEQHFLSGIFL